MSHEHGPNSGPNEPVNPHLDPDSFPTLKDGPDILDLYADGTLILPVMIFDPGAGDDPLSSLHLGEIGAEAAAYNAFAEAHNREVMEARGLVNEALRDVPGAKEFEEGSRDSPA